MMHIFAGKSVKSPYDNRVRIHLAVTPDPTVATASAVCSDVVISPLKQGSYPVDVTCEACADAAIEVQELLA